LSDDSFDWGQLGESWWLDTGKKVAANIRQIRFAAARHAGCSQSESARRAGFGSSPSAQRTEGYRLSRSNKCNQLLALASSEVGGFDGTLTVKESKQILTSLARGSDPSVRIKSIEALAKIDAAERAAVKAQPEVPTPILAARLIAILPDLADALVELFRVEGENVVMKPPDECERITARYLADCGKNTDPEEEVHA
jgi:hypothetical protein